MGVSIILTRFIHVGGGFAENTEDDIRFSVKYRADKSPTEFSTKTGRLFGYHETIADWGKSYHIFDWFDFRLHGYGKFDSDMFIRIMPNDLRALYLTCKMIKEDRDMARKHMPLHRYLINEDGSYPDWYFESIDFTVDCLYEIVRSEDFEDNEYYLHIS